MMDSLLIELNYCMYFKVHYNYIRTYVATCSYICTLICAYRIYSLSFVCFVFFNLTIISSYMTALGHTYVYFHNYVTILFSCTLHSANVASYVRILCKDLYSAW